MAFSQYPNFVPAELVEQLEKHEVDLNPEQIFRLRDRKQDQEIDQLDARTLVVYSALVDLTASEADHAVDPHGYYRRGRCLKAALAIKQLLDPPADG